MPADVLTPSAARLIMAGLVPCAIVVIILAPRLFAWADRQWDRIGGRDDRE